MDLPVFDLTGRTAIVTGGGRGIGKGICLALAQAGANIVVANRDSATAAETVREVQALGRKSLAIQTDVCQSNQVGQMVKKTVEAFGTIDILVNNAGGTTKEMRVPPLETTEEIWDAAIDLNLKSIFLCSQAAAKVMMQQKKGNIINISSWYAYMPSMVSMPYGAAKAGVNNLTQTMANVLGPYNIRVNAVAPGAVPTGSGDPEMRERRRKSCPLGRLGVPEDIAWAVVYFASDASSYVTGQVLSVDGAIPKIV
jgi:NAD(P)-dependent dehydrogenase (short-subunit alcohol dehydrogenase family)